VLAPACLSSKPPLLLVRYSSRRLVSSDGEGGGDIRAKSE